MKSFNSIACALAHSGLQHPGVQGVASMTLRNRQLLVTVTEAGVLSEMRHDADGTGVFDNSVNVLESPTASEGFALRFGGYGFFSSTNRDEEIVRGVLSACVHPEDGRAGVSWDFGSPRLLLSQKFFLDSHEARLDVISTVRYCALQDGSARCTLVRSFNPLSHDESRLLERSGAPGGEGVSIRAVMPEYGFAVQLTGFAGAQIGMLSENGHEEIPDSFWVSGRVTDEVGSRREGIRCLVNQRSYESSFQHAYTVSPVTFN